jgi:DNA-binding NtrC family response regulator
MWIMVVESEPGRGPLQIVVVGSDDVLVQRLPERGAVTLGRSPPSDVRIDNSSVSRRHAVLHVGATLRIQDLGSANGTFVSDRSAPREEGRTLPLRQLTREAVEIAVGERFNLGAVTVVVRCAAPPAVADEAGPERGPIVDAPAMLAVYEQARRAAQSPLSILLLGETGVGKEVLARAIHDASPRRGGPFIELNCAALAPSVLESELFGHDKGAFTGAAQAHPGLFEAAAGGTLFLDEIGELAPDIQVKLLRAVEDRKIRRVGGRVAREVDVRFVAATNRDLEREAAEGRFRPDLFFRLNGVSLHIPPLRERFAEIAPLAARFAAQAAHELKRPIPTLAPETLGLLQRHAWPGNVRELRNVVTRAVVLCAGAELRPEDLPPKLTSAVAPVAALDEGVALQRQMRALERKRIIDALTACAGNQRSAAEALGMSLRTLVNRLDEHDIPRPRKRR